MLLEDMLYEAGFFTLGPVSTASEVQRKLATFNADLVIIDMDGARAEVETALDAAEKRGVPSLLIGSVRHFSEFADVRETTPRLAKPLDPQQLLNVIVTAIAVSRSASPPRSAERQNDSSEPA